MRNQNTKYKAVIFDLGDVYFQNGFKKAISNLVKKHKLPKGYEEKVFEKPFCKKIETGKISEDEYWDRLKNDCGLDIEKDKMRRFVFSHFKPTPGMRQLVKNCRKNFKVGLLTNNIKEWYNYQNKKENFKKRFDKIVVSAEVGTRKPGRKIYLLIAKELGVRPKDCIFFDDYKENVIGAKKVGMTAFHFKNVKSCERDLKKIGIL